MAALRAHTLFHKDQHYVIQDGEIVIVDEFTGRLMSGRRWSEGLHQAVEAKEGVEIKRETKPSPPSPSKLLPPVHQTFRHDRYRRYRGFEFQSIYNLETVIIPTNRPVQRKDFNDQIFRSAEENSKPSSKTSKNATNAGSPSSSVPPASKTPSWFPVFCKSRTAAQRPQRQRTRTRSPDCRPSR